MNKKVIIGSLVFLLCVAMASAFSFSMNEVGKEYVLINWTPINSTVASDSTCKVNVGSGGSVGKGPMYLNFEHCLKNKAIINTSHMGGEPYKIYARPGRTWYCLEV